jgi:glyoxylate utilization-related uncharacterized protein
MTTEADRAALTTMSVLPADEVERLPWVPIPACPGVDEKTLWQFGDFVVALVRYAPGSSTPGRGHLVAHHHIWVVSGSCSLAGRRLDAGSYVHVPPDAEHSVGEVGPEGCTLMQMHRPHPPQEAELLQG